MAMRASCGNRSPFEPDGSVDLSAGRVKAQGSKAGADPVVGRLGHGPLRPLTTRIGEFVVTAVGRSDS